MEKIATIKGEKKLVGKMVYVWGDARCIESGKLCPEENAIPKEKAIRLRPEAFIPGMGFTWGLKLRAYAHASVKNPNA